MEITKVNVTLSNRENSNVLGWASITIDGCFVVNNITILYDEAKDRKVMRMPKKVKSDGTSHDYCFPINQETRDLMEKPIIEKYEEELKNANE